MIAYAASCLLAVVLVVVLVLACLALVRIVEGLFATGQDRRRSGRVISPDAVLSELTELRSQLRSQVDELGRSA